ncbi:hypothetical protein CAEBREN_14138 [Caenorhabditis brenneri]|uniref:PAN-3 domain-containing protein n=1 Tax=Caenorhabditis brenneri TaxID=135651 RepID=G0PBY3_CAEBE|nr:hypothetical protein CAEBREN_14138 [Caenorhabditis brenneri]
MLIFCLFSVFFTVSNGQNYQKMVLIYGEPTVGNGYSTHEISWEHCYSMCYWDANCSLSYHYSSQCKLYAYGNLTIKQLNRTDGKFIGMKRNLTADSCPANPLAGTDSFNDNCIVYRNNITSNGIYCSITYSITLECDSCGTKLFRRDNYWVCVGVKLFADCSPYEDALKMCNRSGWESITGPISDEEMDYFLDQKGNWKNGRRPLLWVDGNKGKFADKTHNGYKRELLQYNSISTEYCLFIGYPTDPPKKISTRVCTDKDAESDCWIGATCLKRYLERNFTTDNCPANPLAGTYSFKDNGTLHKTKITSDGTFWNISYSITVPCDIGTKLFRRDNYLVCLGVKHFSSCGTYSDAVKLCKEDGWESITGPYSVEEFQYFISNRLSAYDYWVDGHQHTFQDQTHNGTSNYPRCHGFGHAYCYYIPQSYNCITSGFCSYCWKGATCLKKVLNF